MLIVEHGRYSLRAPDSDGRMASRPGMRSALARVDTLGLKHDLDAALEPAAAAQYWQAFSDFLAQRLSRAEFAELAQRLLGREHGMSLHINL